MAFPQAGSLPDLAKEVRLRPGLGPADFGLIGAGGPEIGLSHFILAGVEYTSTNEAASNSAAPPRNWMGAA